MNKITEYIKLMRMKHYIKNILIFIPLIFSGMFWDKNNLLNIIIGFVSFCLLASAVYCFNDIKDFEKDKLHPIKKNRPIASGKISKRNAIILMILLLMIAIIMSVWGIYIQNKFWVALVLELLYLILNIAYSCGLKKIPILDIVILVSGFVIRILFGAIITSIEISNWLYLTVILGSSFLAFGKRRNEIAKSGEKAREVLEKYNREFLDKFMYVCLVLTIVFYSLWCIDANTIARLGNNYMVWTIPLLLIIFMKYSLNIEKDSFGDPVDVILGDKALIGLILLFGIMTFGIIYLF